MTKKILIIDDDVDLCAEMRELLGDEGYCVETVSDGKECQAYIEKNPYDIIILDYRMPGLNGVEVLKLIEKKNLKSRVFIATGRPFIEKLLAEEKLLATVAGIINKPFDVQTLLDKINSA